jgi:hypothetical protein
MMKKVLGVDFSGGVAAGRKIWVSLGVLAKNDELTIDNCLRARELPELGPAREICLEALVTLVSGLTDAVIGMDFPFGIPRELISEPVSWNDFVLSFGDKYPTPESFKRKLVCSGPAYPSSCLCETTQDRPVPVYK